MSKYRCLAATKGSDVVPHVGGGETNADNFQCSMRMCLYAVLRCEVVAEGFHFGEGVRVVGAVRGGDAVVEAVEGFFGAA
jgi:hypothetical protein